MFQARLHSPQSDKGGYIYSSSVAYADKRTTESGKDKLVTAKDQLQTDRVMFRTSDPLEHWRERGLKLLP